MAKRFSFFKRFRSKNGKSKDQEQTADDSINQIEMKSDTGTTATNISPTKTKPINQTTPVSTATSEEAEKQQRYAAAERQLEEIAQEYAEKRAVGLVPTKPIPARTLLWLEIEQSRQRAGQRKGCIFRACSCRKYTCAEKDGQCTNCSHGACWHPVNGGANLRSRMPAAALSSHLHDLTLSNPRFGIDSFQSTNLSNYDSLLGLLESDEDEDIANEMAVFETCSHEEDETSSPSRWILSSSYPNGI